MNLQTVTDFFQKDHDRLDRLFQNFKTNKHTHLSEAAVFFGEFKDGLLRHIAWEEDILFPAFELKTGIRNEGPTAVMRFEHQQIKQTIHGIQTNIEKKNISEIERHEGILIETLTEHNVKEEGVLYPSLDQMLTPEEITHVFMKIEDYSSGGHSCCCGHHS